MASLREPLSQLEISSAGELRRLSLSKRDVMREFPSLSARDLRDVGEAQSGRRISSILVRKDALLVKIEHLQLAVAEGRLVLFDAHLEHVEFFARKLQKQLREGVAWVNGEFVLECLDAALHRVVSDMQTRLQLILLVGDQLISNVVTDEVELSMSSTRLVPLKNGISSFVVDVRELLGALEHVLEDQDKLAAMPGDQATAESVMDHYSREAQEVLNELLNLQRNIEDVEVAQTHTLSLTRNRLMGLNLKVSMGALGFGAGAALGGLFGMNIANPLEESGSGAFLVTVGAIAAASWGVYMRSLSSLRESTAGFNTIRRIIDQPFWEKLGDPVYFHKLKAGGGLGLAEYKSILEASRGRAVSEEETVEHFVKADTKLNHLVDLEELTAQMKRKS